MGEDENIELHCDASWFQNKGGDFGLCNIALDNIYGKVVLG